MGTPSPSAIGLLIRQKREAARMSRAKLAQLARISESTLKNVETGRHEPARDTREALAVALDLPQLAGPPPMALEMLDAAGPVALAALLKTYSVQALVDALRMSGLNLWAIFEAIFPASAAVASTMAAVDVAALAREQRT